VSVSFPASSVLFFHTTASTHIYTLSLHDALPICSLDGGHPAAVPDVHPAGGLLTDSGRRGRRPQCPVHPGLERTDQRDGLDPDRSEEHTSELQSRFDLVCRLLLEKKKIHKYTWGH